MSPQRYPPLCFKNLNNQNEPSAKRAIQMRMYPGHHQQRAAFEIHSRRSALAAGTAPRAPFLPFVEAPVEEATVASAPKHPIRGAVPTGGHRNGLDILQTTVLWQSCWVGTATPEYRSGCASILAGRRSRTRCAWWRAATPSTITLLPESAPAAYTTAEHSLVSSRDRVSSDRCPRSRVMTSQDLGQVEFGLG